MRKVTGNVTSPRKCTDKKARERQRPSKEGQEETYQGKGLIRNRCFQKKGAENSAA